MGLFNKNIFNSKVFNTLASTANKLFNKDIFNCNVFNTGVECNPPPEPPTPTPTEPDHAGWFYKAQEAKEHDKRDRIKKDDEEVLLLASIMFMGAINER